MLPFFLQVGCVWMHWGGGESARRICYYHAWLSLLLPPLLSLPLKPISAIRRLSFGIIASLFTVVLSCLIRQHKGFKLAKTFACWAYSAATTSCRATKPLDAEIDDCSEGIRNCWWLPGRFIHTEPLLRNLAGREREISFSFLLPGWWLHCACARFPLSDYSLARLRSSCDFNIKTEEEKYRGKGKGEGMKLQRLVVQFSNVELWCFNSLPALLLLLLSNLFPLAESLLVRSFSL